MKILAMLKDDHDRIRRTIGSLLATRPMTERRPLFAALVEDLQRHLVFEEEVLYPQAALALPMDELEELHADRLEHGGVWELLAELEADLADGEDCDERLEQLEGDLESHMQDEEDNLFPLLQQHMDPEVLQGMALDYERWLTVPTAAE